MSHLTPSRRGRIIQSIKDGASYSQLAAQYHVSKSTIARTYTLWKETGHCNDRPKIGRPHLLSQWDIDRCFLLIRLNHARNAAELQRQYFPHVSVTTIKRVLQERGLRCYVRHEVPMLTLRQKKMRWVWAQVLETWGAEKWRCVIFSDESKFNLLRSDGRDVVWRKPGEGYLVQNVHETKKYGGGHVMVWGCVTAWGVGRLRRVDGTMDSRQFTQILADAYLGTLQDYNISPFQVFLQQDLDSKHTSRYTRTWLEGNHVRLLPWVPQSPDMNIIEHCWDCLDRRVRARIAPPQSVEQLWTALQEEWAQIGKDYIDVLYASMPERLAELKKQHGGHTHY